MNQQISSFAHFVICISLYLYIFLSIYIINILYTDACPALRHKGNMPLKSGGHMHR